MVYEVWRRKDGDYGNCVILDGLMYWVYRVPRRGVGPGRHHGKGRDLSWVSTVGRYSRPRTHLRYRDLHPTQRRSWVSQDGLQQNKHYPLYSTSLKRKRNLPYRVVRVLMTWRFSEVTLKGWWSRVYKRVLWCVISGERVEQVSSTTTVTLSSLTTRHPTSPSGQGSLSGSVSHRLCIWTLF